MSYVRVFVPSMPQDLRKGVTGGVKLLSRLRLPVPGLSSGDKLRLPGVSVFVGVALGRYEFYG